MALIPVAFERHDMEGKIIEMVSCEAYTYIHCFTGVWNSGTFEQTKCFVETQYLHYFFPLHLATSP